MSSKEGTFLLPLLYLYLYSPPVGNSILVNILKGRHLPPPYLYATLVFLVIPPKVGTFPQPEIYSYLFSPTMYKAFPCPLLYLYLYSVCSSALGDTLEGRHLSPPSLLLLSI